MSATEARIGTVEPEWWLRMVCGQFAQEASLAEDAGMRRVVRRAEQRFLRRFRASSGTVGIQWLRELSRWDLPREPAWWTL